MPTIRLSNGCEFICASPMLVRRDFGGVSREALEIRLPAEQTFTYALVLEAFVDGAGVSIVETVQSNDPETGLPMADENGAPVEREIVYDYPEYCIAGAITDFRDGSFGILMGRRTEVETLEEENAGLLLALAGGRLDG